MPNRVITNSIEKIWSLDFSTGPIPLKHPLRKHLLDDDTTIISSDTFSLRFNNPLNDRNLREVQLRYNMEQEERLAKEKNRERKRSQRPTIRK